MYRKDAEPLIKMKQDNGKIDDDFRIGISQDLSLFNALEIFLKYLSFNP